MAWKATQTSSRRSRFSRISALNSSKGGTTVGPTRSLWIERWRSFWGLKPEQPLSQFLSPNSRLEQFHPKNAGESKRLGKGWRSLGDSNPCFRRERDANLSTVIHRCPYPSS